MEKLEWRDVFSRQPAHMLLMDVSPPMNLDTLHDICKVMEDVIALGISLKGSPRLSTLGIYSIGLNFECIFPLQYLKQNFVNFTSSLENVKAFHVLTSNKTCSADFSIGNVLNDAVQQYENFYQEQVMAKAKWPLLQITLITSRPTQKLSKCVQDEMDKLHYSSIKKIQIVSVPCPQKLLNIFSQERDVASNSNSSPELFDSSEELINPKAKSCTGILEVKELSNNHFSFENFFKTWLNDYITDSEHLRIHIDGDLILKCDIHECLVNPDTLPVGSQFYCSADAGFIQHALPNHPGKVYNKVPVYNLETIGIVKCKGVCQSIIYGQPLIMGCTQCWKIQWEELVKNQHLFSAVNNYLLEHDYAIITKRRCHTFSNETMPQGTFIIFPSKTNSMLLKAVAPRELLMPNIQKSFNCSEIPEALVNKVRDCIHNMNILDKYNPLFIPSGLYSHLSTSLKRCRVPHAKKPTVVSTCCTKKSETLFAFSAQTKKAKIAEDEGALCVKNIMSGTDFVKASYLYKKFPAGL